MSEPGSQPIERIILPEVHEVPWLDDDVVDDAESGIVSGEVIV